MNRRTLTPWIGAILAFCVIPNGQPLARAQSGLDDGGILAQLAPNDTLPASLHLTPAKKAQSNLKQIGGDLAVRCARGVRAGNRAAEKATRELNAIKPSK